jgi:hypothetical protein
LIECYKKNSIPFCISTYFDKFQKFIISKKACGGFYFVCSKFYFKLANVDPDFYFEDDFDNINIFSLVNENTNEKLIFEKFIEELIKLNKDNLIVYHAKSQKFYRVTPFLIQWNGDLVELNSNLNLKAVNSNHGLYNTSIHKSNYFDYGFIINPNHEYFQKKRNCESIKNLEFESIKEIKKREEEEGLKVLSTNGTLKENPFLKLSEINEDIFDLSLAGVKHITSSDGVKKVNIMLITQNYNLQDYQNLNSFFEKYPYNKNNQKLKINFNVEADKYFLFWDIDDWDLCHKIIIEKEDINEEDRNMIKYYEFFCFYLLCGIVTKEILEKIYFYYLNYKKILIERYSSEEYFKNWRYKLKIILDFEMVYKLVKNPFNITDKIYEIKHKKIKKHFPFGNTKFKKGNHKIDEYSILSKLLLKKTFKFRYKVKILLN